MGFGPDEVLPLKMMITYLVLGSIAGFIVAGWHSYKDSPYEGFHLWRFLRSPARGALIGLLFFYLSNQGLVAISNPGLFLLSTITFERLIGEIYKGFLRANYSPEFTGLYRVYRVPQKTHVQRVVVGVFLAIITVGLVAFILKAGDALAQLDIDYYKKILLFGLIAGFMAGCAGAWKDAPQEGFKLKFFRSPLISLVGAFFISMATKPSGLFLFGVIGFERIFSELHKSYILGRTRSLFEGMKPKYPQWFGKRWIFAAIYLLGSLFAFFLLFAF